MTATPGSLGLTTNQFNNAKGIIAAVKARGWGIKAAYISVETVLTESGMHIIASANVPASKKYPHDFLSWTNDGLGHDHASMGMYQQQTGYAWTPAGFGSGMNQTTMDSPNGWGTPAELMSAQTSTTKFLNALARHDWSHMSNWAAAQAVQGSAFSDGSNYRQNDSRAISIVNALWSTDWFDMATLADLEAAIRAEIPAIARAVALEIATWDIADGPAVAPLYKVLVNTQAAVAAANTKLDALAKTEATEVTPTPAPKTGA